MKYVLLFLILVPAELFLLTKTSVWVMTNAWGLTVTNEWYIAAGYAIVSFIAVVFTKFVQLLDL
jgi:hypothetical protein